METAQDSPPAADKGLLDTIQNEGVELLLPFAAKLLVALLIIIIGFWLVRRVLKVNDALMEKREVDPTLRPFLRGFLNFLLRAVVLITAISTLGVAMTSIIAILGSVGLAIGLALQGSLANFAGGVIILTLKPFKVGEFIEAQGVSGSVREISIINTTLNTVDNKLIFIPNGPLAGGTITNYTREKIRRVDMTFGVGYDDDLQKVQALLEDIISKTEHVLQEPQPPFVRVGALADSSVNFTVRIWTATENYWNVFFHLQREVKMKFDEEGISIPYPQRDIHMHQVASAN